jgi:hypothetical protein
MRLVASLITALVLTHPQVQAIPNPLLIDATTFSAEAADAAALVPEHRHFGKVQNQNLKERVAEAEAEIERLFKRKGGGGGGGRGGGECSFLSESIDVTSCEMPVWPEFGELEYACLRGAVRLTPVLD